MPFSNNNNNNNYNNNYNKKVFLHINFGQIHKTFFFLSRARLLHLLKDG